MIFLYTVRHSWKLKTDSYFGLVWSCIHGYSQGALQQQITNIYGKITVMVLIFCIHLEMNGSYILILVIFVWSGEVCDFCLVWWGMSGHSYLGKESSDCIFFCMQSLIYENYKLIVSFQFVVIRHAPVCAKNSR